MPAPTPPLIDPQDIALFRRLGPRLGNLLPIGLYWLPDRAVALLRRRLLLEPKLNADKVS